jgi:hypothetical protein
MSASVPWAHCTCMPAVANTDCAAVGLPRYSACSCTVPYPMNMSELMPSGKPGNLAYTRSKASNGQHHMNSITSNSSHFCNHQVSRGWRTYQVPLDRLDGSTKSPDRCDDRHLCWDQNCGHLEPRDYAKVACGSATRAADTTPSRGLQVSCGCQATFDTCGRIKVRDSPPPPPRWAHSRSPLRVLLAVVTLPVASTISMPTSRSEPRPYRRASMPNPPPEIIATRCQNSAPYQDSC